MMKLPLLINHFCCSLLDFLFCTMSTPYGFLHNIAFLGVGLFSYLGVSQSFQLSSGLTTCLLVCSSYIYLFETRSSSLQMNRWKMSWPWVRGIYHLIVFLFAFSIIPLIYLRPDDQLAAKLDSLARDPCPTREFFDNPVLIISTDPHLINFVFYFLAPMIILHTNFHLVFHVSCTVYYLYIVPNKSTSVENRKNQQRFFIGILFQTAIPSFFLFAILFLVVFDSFTHQVTQAAVNSAVISAATHGIIESVTILIVHRSYREAVFRRKSRRVSDNHRVKPRQPDSSFLTPK
uniref:Serpentine Receptor, class H n=1 Tax=Caenorhabditis tropicalis TaxID=1561998 RepID=A0A1I7UU55_9PELO